MGEARFREANVEVATRDFVRFCQALDNPQAGFVAQGIKNCRKR